MTKNILITGDTGFVGTSLVSELKEDNNIITLNNKRLENICEKNTKKLFKDVDIIYHLASTVHNYHILNKEEYHLDVNTNCNGTINVLSNMLEECPNAKLVYTSTFFVNNGNPKALYPSTKLCAEHIIKSFSNVYNIDYSIARLSNVFGYGEQTDNNKKAAFDRMLYNLVNNKDINLYEETKKIKRDYIYIKDVISALEIIGKYGYKDTYNVGYGNSNTITNLINYAKSKLDYKGTVNYIPNPDFHKKVAVGSYCSDTKTLINIGWEPKYNVYKGIDITLKKYLDDNNDRSQ